MASDHGTAGFRVLASPDFYRKAFRKIGRAARVNAIPGAVILACEGAIIGAYYGCRPCTGAFDGVSRTKTSWGYGFSALATAVFGGLLPWAVMVARRDIAGGPLLVLASLALLAAQWAGIGCVVESLYRLQGVMFGNGVSAGAIVCKVLFDQFVYNPLLGCWLVVMLWIPAVSIIYCMPPSLQVPLFDFVLCFSNLLLLLVTKPDAPAEATVEIKEQQEQQEQQVD
eukprot:m51a1_g14484 hypothetical protein (226) ;mRNA; f:724008-729849